MSKDKSLNIEPEQFKELSRTDPLDWILTALYVCAFVAILLIFEVLQRAAHLLDLIRLPKIGKNSYQQWMALLFNLSLRYATALLAMRIDASFVVPLDKGKAYIFVANHQSLFDTFLLSSILKSWNPRFIAKQELGRWIPGISFNLTAGGHALIDRSNPRQAIAEIEQFAKRAHDNSYSIIVFPEGTRSRDGSLLPYRSSGFQKLAAALPNVEVVPVAIEGSWRTAANRKSAIPRGIKISIDFGAPFSTKDTPADAILAEARKFTETMIAERRGGSLPAQK